MSHQDVFTLRKYKKGWERENGRVESFHFHMYKNNRSIPPGSLQYNLTPEIISKLNIDTLLRAYPKDSPIYRGSSNDTKWTFLTPTEASNFDLKKCTPDTKKGRSGQWSIIIGGYDSFKNSGIEQKCYKLALLDKNTDKILLVNIFNTGDLDSNHDKNISRTIKSLDSNWSILPCKMIAPLCFWHQLYLSIVSKTRTIDDLLDSSEFDWDQFDKI